MDTLQAGCELKITEKAASVFKDMIADEKKDPENSYLRVGANSGGCSGWKYSLDFEDMIDPEDLTFEQYDVKLVVDENENIIDGKFKTFGCGSAIASSSLATEWVKGKSLDEAHSIQNTHIVEELSLPPVKIHCSVLAEDAIKAAIKDYKSKQVT